MKSLLFCTAYVNPAIQEMHPKRYSKWLKFYKSIMSDLGADHLFMIDDCSNKKDLQRIGGADAFYAAENLPAECEGRAVVLSFDSHLGRPAPLLYPGWWRSFTYSLVLAEKYHFDKIIHIESDFFILSDRLRAYIGNIKTGWEALYSRAFNFPETAVQVICKDSFPRFREVLELARRHQFIFNRMAELVIPFTKVNKDFTGDRVGEFQVLKQWARKNDAAELDYIGQLSPDIRVPSSGEFYDLLSAFNSRLTGAENMDFAILMELLTANRLIEAE